MTGSAGDSAPDTDHAVVLAVRNFRRGAVPDDGDEVPLTGGGGLPELEFAPGRAAAVGSSLAALGYRLHGGAVLVDPGLDLARTSLDDAVGRTPVGGGLVVHLISHGHTDSSGSLRIALADSARGDGLDVESWLRDLEREGRPAALIMLDVCHAGAAVRWQWNNWSMRLRAEARSADARRAWVLAAAAPEEKAFNGRFSEAVAAVLQRLRADGLETDPSLEFVPVSLVTREIRATLDRLWRDGKGMPQHLDSTPLALGEEPALRLFRNPRFAPTTLARLRLGAEDSLRSFLAELDPVLDAHHYITRAFGARDDSVGSCLFSGRDAELAVLTPWLNNTPASPLPAQQSPAPLTDTSLPDPSLPDTSRPQTREPGAPQPGAGGAGGPHSGGRKPGARETGAAQPETARSRVPPSPAGPPSPSLAVVTGGPGTGKSALLGMLVCAAHPQLRRALLERLPRQPRLPGRATAFAAVHARGRETGQLASSIGRQLGLPVPAAGLTPVQLIGALRRRAERGHPVATVVVDALDEALNPADVVDLLLLPLAGARAKRARSGTETAVCRLLAGTRDVEDTAAVVAGARERGLLLDLDDADRTVLRDDVAEFVRRHLELSPLYDAGHQDELRERLGGELADALVGEEAHAGAPGPYLLARLYLHQLLDAPRAIGTEDIDDVIARAPRTVADMLELDLARLGDPWARPLLVAVAHAKHPGIPAALARAVAPWMNGAPPAEGPEAEGPSAHGPLVNAPRADGPGAHGTGVYGPEAEGRPAADTGRPEDTGRLTAPAPDVPAPDVPVPDVPAPDAPSSDAAVPDAAGTLERVGFYLRRTADPEGPTLYRLFHQELVDHLRALPAAGGGPAAPAVLRALLAPLRPDPAGPVRWRAALPYQLRHALEHAGDAGRADELVADPEFLIHAGPPAPALDVLDGEAARELAAVYRMSARRHRVLDAAARRSVLALDAMRSGRGGLAALLTIGGDGGDGEPGAPGLSGGTGGWSPLWASGSAGEEAPAAVLTGAPGAARRLTVEERSGRTEVLASGGPGWTTRWDLASAQEIPRTVPAGDVVHIAPRKDWGPALARQLRAWASGGGAGGAGGRGRPVRRISFGRAAGVLTVHDERGGEVATVADVLTGVAESSGAPLAALVLRSQEIRLLDLAGPEPLPLPRLTGAPGAVRSVAVYAAGPDRTVVLALTSAGPVIWDTAGPGAAGGDREIRAVPLAGGEAYDDSGPVTLFADERGGPDEAGEQGGSEEPGGRDEPGGPGGPVAAVANGGSVTLYPLDTPGEGRRILGGSARSLTALTAAVAGGRGILVGGSADGSVRVWDLAVPRAPDAGQRHPGPVVAVAAGSAGGRRLLLGACGEEVWMRDPVTGRRTGRIRTGQVGVTALAFTRLGRRPVILTAGADWTLRIWDAQRRTPVGGPLISRAGRTDALAVGRLAGRPVAVTGGDGAIAVWDLLSGSLVGEHATAHDAPVRGLAFAPDDKGGARLVSGGDDGTVRFWELTEQALVQRSFARLPGAVTCVRGVGGLALTGGADRTIRVWDALSGEPDGEPLTGHSDAVGRLTAGRFAGVPAVFSIGADATLRTWDLRGRRPLAVLDLPSAAHDLVWSSPGRIAVGLGRDLVVLEEARGITDPWGGSMTPGTDTLPTPAPAPPGP
ncbi:hypothetical protein ACIBCM_28575 [Streptomyces sp. NPDC051018]|uniref:hypothetical protein n=1 Tax=Streptomyces sp. NPDC051018 TaxID=3365639 RepID=UPI00379B56F8